MLNNHFAEQKVVLNFSVEEVKNAIKEILQKRPAKYPSQAGKQNDIMGVYQFFELGINSLQFNINVIEIEKNKTEIHIRVVPDSTSRANSSVCSQGITDFQLLLTKVLSGEVIEKKGCLGVVLIIAITGFLMLLMI